MEPFLMPGGEIGRDIKVFRDLSVGLTWIKRLEKPCASCERCLAKLFEIRPGKT